MRHKAATKDYYCNALGFAADGNDAYEEYLILQRGAVEIHFFEFKNLQPEENYGQVYIRSNDIEALYRSFIDAGVAIHPNGRLETKPWGQREFSLLDPDHNLLTFGQRL